MKTILTKQIHDIFIPKKKAIEEEKIRIEVDYREKNCLVPSELISLGFQIEFKELKVADYIVKGIAIERKTVSDFISSMINRRLPKQLEELQQYQEKLLIIEGIDEQDLYNEGGSVNPNAIRGFLLSIVLKHKIPIMFTKDSQDTAKFISVMAKKQDKEPALSLKPTKRVSSKKEQMEFILEGFPGIGPNTAKKLLNEFKTIKNIMNASQEELQQIIGKKSESIKKITEDEY